MENAFTRLIEPCDNNLLATIIRAALTEFKANKPGTVYYDDSTNHLYELFQAERSRYYVAILNDKVVGGAGIYPTRGLEATTCELVKMYLSPEARGKGLATLLMNCCLEAAKANKFEKVYIETMPELTIAVPMYEKFGFTYLNGPLGDSGHNGCNLWMLKELDIKN